MKVDIQSELQTAHNKIILAQQKIDQLSRSGKTRRDEEIKYWTGQLHAWTGYANELNELAQHGYIEITKTMMSSGAFHVTASSNGNYLKNILKKHIPLEILDALSTGQDYSLNNPPCERCGAMGTELHHWAPKELFEDAEAWPKSYLCKRCHTRWHLIVTTPYRTLRRKEQQTNGKPAA